jgi:branched-chain amino acid transport system substrate-binding protein
MKTKLVGERSAAAFLANRSTAPWSPAALGLSAAFTQVASGCAPPPPEPLEPVKVGVLSSTSGALGSFGASLQKAIFLAQEQVNAAGGVFDGRPLELVVRDTASDPSQAAALAEELVDVGVAALVGPETSGQSGAVLAVAEAAEIPMVSCCATSASLSAQASAGGGFFFRTAPSDALQGKALAFLAKNGVSAGGVDVDACPQVAFFTRPDSYGQGFRDVFLANYPASAGELIASAEFPNADPNAAEIDGSAATFANTIVASADPTEQLCIVFITFGFEGAKVAKGIDAALQAEVNDAASRVFGLQYHYLTGDGAQESAFLQEMQNASEALRARVVGTVPFHATSAAYDQFVTAFSARFGEPPSAYTSQAFDAMFVTALAATHARSTVGKDIRNALFSVSGRDGGVKFDGGNFFGEIAARILDGDEVDYVGPSGDLTFDAIGDVQGDYVIWQLEDVDGALSFVDKVPLPVSEFNPN